MLRTLGHTRLRRVRVLMGLRQMCLNIFIGPRIQEYPQTSQYSQVKYRHL